MNLPASTPDLRPPPLREGGGESSGDRLGHTLAPHPSPLPKGAREPGPAYVPDLLPLPSRESQPGPTPEALARLQAALDRLTDPEIPVITLREMGILRAVRRAADGQVEVVITPTYSGCPAMDQIAGDVARTLREHGIAGRVVTQLAPAWTTDWMSEAAREKLRAWGIAPPVRCGGGDGTDGAPRQYTRRRATVPCPNCGSRRTHEISHFGSTACKALYRCLDCLEPFDYFKPL